MMSSRDDPGMTEVIGRVLIATIIALVFVLILLFLFHVYARWLWQRRQQSSNMNRRSQDQHSAGVTVLRRGLDAAFLKTIPVLVFDSKDEVECSVCLSELEEGEKTRILPKCNHVFHAECIDMWFHSHSTCPVCRNPVSEQTEISVESLLEDHQMTREHLPTNVLFWGDETEVSTLTSQLQVDINNNHQQAIEPASSSSSSSSQTSDRLKPDLVIDIPMQQASDEEEDEKTPIMRSLRRMLSSTRRFNPFSPGSEQAPQT